VSSLFDEYLALYDDAGAAGRMRACPSSPAHNARRRSPVVLLATAAVLAVGCAAIARAGLARAESADRSAAGKAAGHDRARAGAGGRKGSDHYA